MHHAYVYEGPLSLLPALADSAKDLFNFSGEGNPDVHIYSFEKLNIDEARALASEASFKSVSGRALYVLGAGSISHEAQQALLKLFEEPQEGTMFVLLVPHGMLISTLRSRFVEYPKILEAEDSNLAPASKFLKSAYKERSAQIVAMLKEEEGAKERVREFVAMLEHVLHTAHTKKPSQELRSGLSDIALVRGYLADRSASLKMLLEHLAATLPAL
jgi:hypothetical protein